MAVSHLSALVDVLIGQQITAYVKSLLVRNPFDYFLQPETLLWRFHQSAACTTPASPDLFHTAVLICAQIYTVNVAVYQVSGLVCLTSTAVFTCITFYSQVLNLRIDQHGKITNLFFPQTEQMSFLKDGECTQCKQH